MFRKRKSKDAATNLSVSPAWLAWPTLRHGGGQIKTAGVQYHPDALKRVQASAGSLVMAELRIETTGQFAGAVRVFVAGELLGSIPHDLAEKFRAAVSSLSESGLPATCRALLEVGNWSDVWLDARPEPRPPDDPFLPPFSSFQVELAPGEAERLDEGLHSKAKNKRVVAVGWLAAVRDGWQVLLDDRPLGMISEGMPAVQSAVAAGMPLTCQVRILREQDKGIRVMADLPPN